MKQIISPDYLAMNRQLHADHDDYGVHSGDDAQVVISNARSNGYKVVLDFGCGKGTLKPAILALAPELTVLEFDPAIEGKDTLPATPVDFVVCMDVMEHIEPDFLDAVFKTITGLKPKMILFKIALLPANKFLPDGRNAHILLRPIPWWRTKLKKYFKPLQTQEWTTHYIYFAAPL